jgi:hypothetical protein
MKAEERGSIGELLRETLDRNSRETLAVKEDCSGVKIVFLSSIVQSEGWHQVVTARLPHYVLNGSFDNVEDLGRWLEPML